MASTNGRIPKAKKAAPEAGKASLRDMFSVSPGVHLSMTKKAVSASRKAINDAKKAIADAGERIEKAKKVATGKKLAGDIRPLRSHSAGDLNAKAAQPDKVAADTARYEALACEHGADLSEEGFNEALRKVGKARPAQ